MQSEYFIFDGIESSSMGVFIVNISSGQSENPLRAGSSVKERTRKNNVSPTFLGVERGTIEFNVTVALMDNYMNFKEWTAQDKFNISRWLLQDKYKSFQTSSDLGKIYYVICTSEANFISSGGKGYIELTFKTNSYCAWSPLYLDDFDLTNNETTQIISLENRSNIVDIYRPKLEIKPEPLVTAVSIKNISNGGQEIAFTGLGVNEIVSIDNENRIVLSNLLGSNAFAKKNDGWLELVYGINQIEVKGKCKIWVKSQFPIMQ